MADLLADLGRQAAARPPRRREASLEDGLDLESGRGLGEGDSLEDGGFEEGSGGYLANVSRAKQRLSNVEARVQGYQQLAGARQAIEEAIARAGGGPSMKAALEHLASLETHLSRDHWPSEGGESVTPGRRRGRSHARMREAFKASVIFGRPRGEDPFRSPY